MQDEKKSKKKLLSKKRLLITGLSILAIVAIVFFVKIASDSWNKEFGVSIESANALKVKAIKALKDDDSKMAKDLFEQAQEQYEKLGDTNNVVDTKAQIYLIEHASN